MDKHELRESRFFILFLSCLVSLAPLSIDMYMPAMAQMADYFSTDFAAVNLTMSAYFFGNAIGQLFGGSLSDQIGRRRVGIIGLSIFFLTTLAITQSQTIEQMQYLRIFQALGGGFATVICIAQVRDIFPTEEVMKRYANVVMVMLIAPMIAPSIGVVLIQFGWQSIFALLAALSLAMLLVFVLVIPETRSSIRNTVSIPELFSGYWQVINHRVDGRITAIRYALYSGFSSGVFLCFLTNSAMIFMNRFEFGEFQFAIGFAAIGVAMILGNRLSVRMADRMPAERWLRIASIVQLLCIASLILMSVFQHQSAVSVAVLMFFIISMSGSITPTASGRYITFFTDLAGSAASLATTLTFGLGATIGAIAAVVSGGEILPVFITMGCSALIAIAILLTIKIPNENEFA